MGDFSRFFTMVGERWPQASGCLVEWEKLLAPVRKEYVDFLYEKSCRASEVTFEELASFMEIGPTGSSLEDALNFEPFNTTNAQTDDLLGYYCDVPNDWNAEFSFGMEDLVPYPPYTSSLRPNDNGPMEI
jgi:hypothetical protein